MNDDLLVCRCEEVTYEEVEEAIGLGLETVNEVKRATRAGFGLCQGRTCSRLIQNILVSKTGLSHSEIKPGTSRPPVRPIPVRVLANRKKNDDE
jgi:NAD(P)H-nitrite reductase large subunit